MQIHFTSEFFDQSEQSFLESNVKKEGVLNAKCAFSILFS